MPTLTIRNLDADLVVALKSRAAEHGRSMEAEARVLIANAFTSPVDNGGLGSRIRERFASMDSAYTNSDIPIERSPDVPRAARFD